ncbi:hypothetical protein GXP71_01380 [Cellulomonas sp. H30R-01]|uniref:hypothetical protein n=1 Tax=Cellulomonas sp. H30R-01 TaxID=2704467 RepID=UPI00138CE151|nr:hypothetical protein [Cellulomonas sp. H30R-01]QHT54881.1 hypothetical protein GXP71_01380 [Cellulomonas sp. H30R-01]
MARRRPRRHRGRRAGCLAVALVVALGGGVAAVVTVLRLQDEAPPVVQRCAATVDGTTWFLSPEQADNAALIAATAVRRGLPARAVTIGLATALQESKLVNVDYGDRDSLGLFQQRPSQGWGTPEQVQDPVYATGIFYDRLVQVPGYEELPITEAAQAVQRSGYPDAYAQHEVRARAYASALTGWSPAALSCTLRDPAPGMGTVEAVTARLHRDLGELPVTSAPREDGGVDVVIDLVPLSAPDEAAVERRGWSVAQWAVAVAEPLGLTQVATAGQVWDRTEASWTAATAADAPTTGQVRLTLAP